MFIKFEYSLCIVIKLSGLENLTDIMLKEFGQRCLDWRTRQMHESQKLYSVKKESVLIKQISRIQIFRSNW